MARIEINLLEYNGMIERIKTLENENVDVRKQNELLFQKINDMSEVIDNVYNSGFFERLFRWNKNILSMLKKYVE